jgi:hypothetical protein
MLGPVDETVERWWKHVRSVGHALEEEIRVWAPFSLSLSASWPP